MKLLTWLDVERRIRKLTNNKRNLPLSIKDIDCFSDGVEIMIDSLGFQQQAAQEIQQWFGDWYDTERRQIRLDIENAFLPVDFVVHGEMPKQEKVIVPLWRELAYLSKDEPPFRRPMGTSIPRIVAKTSGKQPPHIVAFHSFKGGVGRTTHMAGFYFSLLQRAHDTGKPISILVIDADLEAPGLTYWDRQERLQPEISFIDFLEVYHYPPVEREKAMEAVTNQLASSRKQIGNSTVFFLPAFCSEEQLLDTPILPQHLARSAANPWQTTTAIRQLGQAVQADVILIDLRAGLSDLASPILMDAQIERFLVTTLSEQSIHGTCLVLEQMAKLAPPPEETGRGQYYDPTVIVTMLTPELRKSSVYEDAVAQLQEAYDVHFSESNMDDNGYDTRLTCWESYFSQELLYVKSWDDARDKTRSNSSLTDMAIKWAGENWPKKDNRREARMRKGNNDLQQVVALRDQCEEYAEKGIGDNLLVTDALRNLAIKYRDELPQVISIGAKGAGKTFSYLHLARCKHWETFVDKVSGKENGAMQKKCCSYIYPLLAPKQLDDKMNRIIREARDQVTQIINDATPSPDQPHTKTASFAHHQYFVANGISDLAIKSKLDGEPEWGELNWIWYWLDLIAKAMNIHFESPAQENLDIAITSGMHTLNRQLEKGGLRLVLIIDGLEELFDRIADQRSQQVALKALLDFPKRLQDTLRQSSLGMIIFLRKDYLRYAIRQNAGQMESRYKPYELTWDQDSFLHLVYWLGQQARFYDPTIEVNSLGRTVVINELEQLWGKKLGKDNSKEANSAAWVYAALSDFKGRLQARDIVRFLYHAAKKTSEDAEGVGFRHWQKDRILPPQAIRHALRPCSEKKLEEVMNESGEFKTWFEDMKQLAPDKRRVPFTVQQLGITPTQLEFLKNMGVLYEDTDKDGLLKYYIPEIYRIGMNFELEQSKKPRVLALKKKSMGKGLS
ncbi:KGGVGR-motif variant AAA ATPase [Heliophilum fasciatum]|uniref:MinD-like ATPase involved in chromosome partitioning or flagellar assembly n=1 Tax=Heliophilum fasciatum TaxID=35700 RepID=A0A4R2S8K6_9FIRM|nr:ParA family protein [Heliophilum fasciatum]MCW2276788.1 MinD-like ATPase involved in chromosome partitioning or flagellar assembly [Heliophilum fasciatum]TCP68751.1 MinD-like ATPase involved in chromosome partitioning or flagellar assembly [Heliophilum fasciatum]